jgi:FAD/FMN-containing dehydrogenase
MSGPGPARRVRRRMQSVRRWVLGVVLVTVLVVGILAGDRYSSAPDGPRACTAEVRPVSFGDPGVAPTAPEPPETIPDLRGLRQIGGGVNDASCLNEVPVHGVVRPGTEEDVVAAVAYARRNDLAVSVSGTRHAMGGQASYPGGLVLDMRGFDTVAVDAAAGTVRVGAGATWRSVLEALHAEGRAVAAMPSIDILSVGGTVSVNAHGVDFRRGSIAGTVRSLRLVSADGTVRDVDRTSDPDLFAAVIGGYGLFGVITEVELETVPDTVYRLEQRVIPSADLARTYLEEVVPDEDARLMYAHLSTAPSSFLAEAILYTYSDAGTPGSAAEPIGLLKDTQNSRVGRFALNLARHGGFFQEARWAAQKHVLPSFQPCATSRNAALRDAEACMVARTQATYNGLGLLNHKLPDRTDVLHEYFVEPDRLGEFLQAAAPVLRDHDAELLSASVRVVHRDEVLLSYAQGTRLSVVLYLSQDLSDAGNADMAGLTRRLVNLALEHDATFYLPYQPHYTREQVAQAYPTLDKFFALKRQHDPEERFRNAFSTRFS